MKHIKIIYRIYVIGFTATSCCGYHIDDTFLRQRWYKRIEIRGFQTLYGESAA